MSSAFAFVAGGLVFVLASILSLFTNASTMEVLELDVTATALFVAAIYLRLDEKH